MRAEFCLRTSTLLLIFGIVCAVENYMDYADESPDKSPTENIHQLYRLILQRNAMENGGFGEIPLEHLMIRKSQRSPSLRLRFGRSGSPHVSTGLLSKPMAAVATGFEDNN
ncbi:short neuropeptide F-like [Polistes fuscatus]|uniref:short neuropeptide F-like n=1 Tax=Polistes canadensis TaxID=91411 RepID=UPI000718EAC7|nr:PREDICTED: short neuropeptide F-like [Polistes canadensis]XP_043499369.1 short neuropeptide F-like [Polistes fuscatus]